MTHLHWASMCLRFAEPLLMGGIIELSAVPSTGRLSGAAITRIWHTLTVEKPKTAAFMTRCMVGYCR